MSRTPYPDHGTFWIRIISSRIFDAFYTEDGAKASYAYTTLKVCLRRTPISGSLEIPPGWKDVELIDTEFFELPHGTTLQTEPKTLDDMEKVHVVYIAGVNDGKFVCKPVYIGIGTGEAYGVGPCASRHEGAVPLLPIRHQG